jgi:hypothetical protein
MDFQNSLCPLVIRNNYDVRFFSDADLVADRVYAFLLLVSIEGQIIKTAVRESISIIFGKRTSALGKK